MGDGGAANFSWESAGRGKVGDEEGRSLRLRSLLVHRSTSRYIVSIGRCLCDEKRPLTMEMVLMKMMVGFAITMFPIPNPFPPPPPHYIDPGRHTGSHSWNGSFDNGLYVLCATHHRTTTPKYYLHFASDHHQPHISYTHPPLANNHPEPAFFQARLPSIRSPLSLPPRRPCIFVHASPPSRVSLLHHHSATMP